MNNQIYQPLEFWFGTDGRIAITSIVWQGPISPIYETSSDPIFNIIRHLLEYGARKYDANGLITKSSFSLRALNKFARCCRQFYLIIVPQLTRSQEIFDRWSPKMKIVLHQKLINCPIKYTGETTICRDITMLGVDGRYGLAPIDHHMNMPNPNLRYALIDVIFITRNNRPFDYILNIGGTSLCEGSVTTEDYIELKLNDRQVRENAVIFGPDDNDRRTQYYCCLKLPTQLNPILLGRDFVPASQIFIMMMRPVMRLMGGRIEHHDVDLMINLVTHAVARYRTVEVTAYDWVKYIAAEPIALTNPIYKQSIIQSNLGQKRMCMWTEDLLWQGIRGRPDGIQMDIVDNFNQGDEPNADDLLGINLPDGVELQDYDRPNQEVMDNHAEWVRQRVDRAADEDFDRQMLAAWMDNVDDQVALPDLVDGPFAWMNNAPLNEPVIEIQPEQIPDPVWTGIGNSLK